MVAEQDARTATIRELSLQIQQLKRSPSPHKRSVSPLHNAAIPAPLPTGDVVSTGLPPLDHHLPHGGFRRGSLVEWLSEGPGAAESLALRAIPHAMQPGGIPLLIDWQNEFYPPGAAELGLDLRQLVILRPSSREEALWAAEQALRCPGVSVVVIWNELTAQRRSADHVLRRFQLAAEVGGSLGILLRPESVRKQACWSDVRLAVRPPTQSPAVFRRQRVSLELLHCRGHLPDTSLELELDHETGAVSLVASMASAASPSRAARA